MFRICWHVTVDRKHRPPLGGCRTPRLRQGPSRQPALEPLEDRNLLSFLPPVRYAVPTPVQSVAVGHFRDNGPLDIVTANVFFGTTSGFVSVLLGNGDGTFQPAVNYPLTARLPVGVAVGDFRGKGITDFAVADASLNGRGSSVDIFLGNGDGTFQMTGMVLVPGEPNAVAVGDFDGDGKLDLVTTNFLNNNVNLLFGNGDGTFQAPITLPTGGLRPSSVAVVDLRGDGHSDIVTGNAGSVSVLLSNGDGTFQPAAVYSDGTAAFDFGQATVGDLTGSGRLDIAAVYTNLNGHTNVLSVLLANGDGTFQDPQDTLLQGTLNAISVAVGNFNGDGPRDVAVGINTFGVDVLVGNGDGTFQPPVEFHFGHAGDLVAADFNGDGFDDLAVGLASSEEHHVAVLINDEQGFGDSSGPRLAGRDFRFALAGLPGLGDGDVGAVSLPLPPVSAGATALSEGLRSPPALTAAHDALFAISAVQESGLAFSLWLHASWRADALRLAALIGIADLELDL